MADLDGDALPSGRRLLVPSWTRHRRHRPCRRPRQLLGAERLDAPPSLEQAHDAALRQCAAMSLTPRGKVRRLVRDKIVRVGRIIAPAALLASLVASTVAYADQAPIPL